MAALQHSLKWVKNVYGGGAIAREYPEGDTETFPKGGVVVYDASEDGIVEPAVTAGTLDVDNVLGLATKAATGVSDTLIPVEVPRPGDIYSCAIASDQDTPVAPDNDNIGLRYNLIKLSTTGGAGTEWVVDEGDTTTLVVKVIDLDPRDVELRGSRTLLAGDRVLVQFIGLALEQGQQA